MSALGQSRTSGRVQSCSQRLFLPKSERNQRRGILFSRRIPLQNATHSLQIKTLGPAMSVRTFCWLLPQNEQYISGSGMAVLPKNLVVLGCDNSSYVRFGSLADTTASNLDVHCYPESGRQPAALPCPLSAKAEFPLVCVRPKNKGLASSWVTTR